MKKPASEGDGNSISSSLLLLFFLFLLLLILEFDDRLSYAAIRSVCCFVDAAIAASLRVSIDVMSRKKSAGFVYVGHLKP